MMKLGMIGPIVLCALAAPSQAMAQGWGPSSGPAAPTPPRSERARTAGWDYGASPQPRGPHMLIGCENRGKSRRERRFCRDMGLPTTRDRP